MQAIEPAQVFEQMHRSSVYLVDVRGDISFTTAREHIPGDLHYSLQDLETLYPRIPRDTYIVVYDAAPGDSRTSRVASFLESKGYRVDRMRGGLDEWKRAGFPTEPLDAGLANAS